jgi:hypothetical protein
MLTVARPEPGDFPAYADDYVRRVAANTVSANDLALQRERVVTMLAPVTEDEAAFRYGPGKWSIKQVVGHITDAERVFAYRLVSIARGDATPLPGFDENAWVAGAGFDARPLSELIADWVTTRNGTLALVKGLPAAAWERRGTANDQPITARALMYLLLGHVEHHCAVLQQRYFELDDR